MPPTCKACRHPKIKEINGRIVRGDPIRRIAGEYEGVSESGLKRHRDAGHIPLRLVQDAEIIPVEFNASDLKAIIDGLVTHTNAVLDRAQGDEENPPDDRLLLAAVREARGNAELLAKLRGEFQEEPQVTVRLSVAEPTRSGTRKEAEG